MILSDSSLNGFMRDSIALDVATKLLSCGDFGKKEEFLKSYWTGSGEEGIVPTCSAGLPGEKNVEEKARRALTETREIG